MENVDFTTVPREDLEAFAEDALRRLHNLEESQASLREQLKVDPDVIDQWREWLATVDGEREKWADTATRLSSELKTEKQENSKLFQHVKDLTVTLERIHDKAKRNSSETARTLELQRAISEILQQAGAAMIDAYEGVLGWPDEVNVDADGAGQQLDEPEPEPEVEEAAP